MSENWAQFRNQTNVSLFWRKCHGFYRGAYENSLLRHSEVRVRL